MNAATLAKACTIMGHTVTYSRVRNRIYFDKAYGGPSYKATTWMAALNAALIQAKCTTVLRVAMFLAQIGEESGSFRYTEELASGAEYEGRGDLGNVLPGDGKRFKGRTYIQITGRHNYRALSLWAYSMHLVPGRWYFTTHPDALAEVQYIFLGPVWYWTKARSMNAYADARDIEGATRAVNGGLNGFNDRNARWLHALELGDALLPTKPKKAAAKPAKHATKPKPVQHVTVKVRANDTLSAIASRHGTTWQKLQRLNNIANPNRIYVGQTLRVA